MEKIYNEFTNMFSLSKTLQFNLIPQGKTLKNIVNKGLLKEDENRAEQYKKAKEIINEYHKDFIEKSLSKLRFSYEELQELAKAYKNAKNKDDESKNHLAKLLTESRKRIADIFKNHEKFNTLFKKELIKNDLDFWLNNKYSNKELSEKKDILKDFKAFTTYFTGFHESRKNIYSNEEHSTGIAYRIIHENFPKYIDNASKINDLLINFPDINFAEIETGLKDILKGKCIKDFFALENFSSFLNQSGIDKYNCIIGGKVLKDNTKLQGVNEVINLYIKKKESLLKNAFKTESNVTESEINKLRSYKLVRLYKQILSDRDSLSFLPEKFENDKSLIDAINNFYEDNKLIFKEIPKILAYLQTGSKLEHVYIRNNRALTDISQALFSDYNLINRALFYYVSNELMKPKKQDKLTKKEQSGWDKYVNKSSYFSIMTLDHAILYYKKNLEDGHKDIKKLKNFKNITQYFSEQRIKEIFECITKSYAHVKSVVYAKTKENSNDLNADKNSVARIKDFLDSLMVLLHLLKPLYIVMNKKEGVKTIDVFEKDNLFYRDFDYIYEKISAILNLYNKVRNYLTKKPYSLEKYKVNFSNPDLLSGWPVRREKACSGIILIKDNKYFLGIMDKEEKKNIKFVKSINKEDYYKKMVYLQAADPQKDVQNLMVIDGKTVRKIGRKDKKDGINYILEELKNRYLPNDINVIRKKGSYSKQSESFCKADLVKFIEYYKQRTIEYFNDYKFVFKPSDQYDHFGEFTDHINLQAYQINFENISTKCINSFVEAGKLYLFQIYNKDFSQYSKGKSNLHTLYWKALFDEQNLADVVYKLNGEAELFYRKASIKKENMFTHSKNEPIENRDKLNNKVYSKFSYDIIKDKRFTGNKFSFHVSITVNFKSSNTFFNKKVNEYIKNNSAINILSINRGERHLAYYTLIDQQGNIKKQDSFNIITNDYKGKKYEKYYHTKLSEAEKKRDAARKSWGTIENIKNLKEGYLSQVVHEICKIMIEHNAIVVFEDLNLSFKRSRLKFEKQIYQKLEKMLIEKLNYLVFKDRNHNEPGGVLKGYQLTAPFTTFKDLGKQTGFIYYVPAYYISKVCPVTGFINLFNIKYESKKQSQEFFKKFDSIIYNKANDYFEFKFNYQKFTSKTENSRQEWTICTYGNRIVNFWHHKKKQWNSKVFRLTEEMKKFFQSYSISITQNNNLKTAICNQDSAEFFKGLTKFLKLTLQMINIKIETDIDYIISPVKNSGGEGKFFDSRDSKDNLPKNVDANGAYHIGLKGLMVLNKINRQDNLIIKNSEWFEFVQKKEYMKN